MFYTVTYKEFYQTSKMKLFVAVTYLNLLHIFTKRFILDLEQGSEYAYDIDKVNKHQKSFDIY